MQKSGEKQTIQRNTCTTNVWVCVCVEECVCVCLLARRPYIVSVLHLSRDYDFVLCALHFDWQLAVGNTLS